jgi:hypothetical protein
MPAIDVTLPAINDTLSNLTANECQCPNQKGLSQGDIAAIILGCIVGLQIFDGLIFWLGGIGLGACLACLFFCTGKSPYRRLAGWG